MSKRHFSNSSHFPSLLLSDLLSLGSFIHSHPLYFAYLIFFFPYILHLLSFLYPLLLSTSLLLISLLTISPHLENTPRCGFLINACKVVLDVLHTSIDNDEDGNKVGFFEPLAYVVAELEACIESNTIVVCGGHGSSETGEELPESLTQPFAYKVGQDQVDTLPQDGGKENYGVVGLDSGRFGSMRREKEWKRTLACKLYEERQTVDGIEGMDLLWEMHEVESGKIKLKNKNEKVKKKKAGKNGEVDCHKEEEEDLDEDIEGQLCCLQALRFSTGKMNLGMGRLNSMRISKAFKGMGLFVRRERKIP